MFQRAPLVSIGMPLFNAEKTLDLTVRSILNQTYSNWELFLIDDGSKDQTLALARTFKDSRIKVIEGSANKGLPARLNQAVSMAAGHYFARMDQDDIAYPERLETQVRFLMDHVDIDLVGSWVVVFQGDGMLLGKRGSNRCTHAEICSHPHDGFPLVHPTWLGRAQWFRAHPYRVEAIMMEDQDLLLRTHTTSRFACLPRVLLGYREERLSLKKILRTRYQFSSALVRHARLGRRHLPLIEIQKQIVKAFVDIFAITTGLDYKLLRHRGGPLKQEEIDRWNDVWESTNRS